ncbi:MAG: NAD(P)-dependent oxidoreductase [Myxococcales bacterium FL481]|nr:MAG: NAD(P)-dependent oxidoreductase [Myxococcales bacterium FL481]
MDRLRQIGFLGLGTMGQGMVANLLAAGYDVCGYNRTPGRASALVAAGMLEARAPQDCVERADIAILCVADDSAVRAVALGPEGVVASLAAGSVLVDTGTTSLAMTTELADACSDRGVRFVDAPITGSKLGAQRGALTFMVGGAVPDVEQLHPLFQAMGRHVVHVGEAVGAGQSAKYCLNMTQSVVLQGVLEGYALAGRLGVRVEKLAEIFENSAGKTGVGSFKTPYLFNGDFTPHFRLALMHKDLHLALAEAHRAGIPLPAASATCHIYDQSVAEGLGDEDFLAVAKLVERWAGVQLRPCDPS